MSDGNHGIKKYTEERYDLAGPVRLNAAILTTNAAGAIRRLPWQADDPKTMDPATWGTANSSVTLTWAPQPGTLEYRIYRAAKPDVTAARLVQSVRQATQMTDLPGPGTFYYGLTTVDSVGESQFRGPQSFTSTAPGAAEPLVFRGQAEPPILFPNLPDLSVFPGAAKAFNVTVAAKTLTARVFPAGPVVTTETSGDGHWRLAVTMPRNAKFGVRYSVMLTGAGESGQPLTAKFSITAAPVEVIGQFTRTGGTLTLNTAAAAGQPVTTINWAGEGSLPTIDVGRRGYVLFRYKGYTHSVLTRKIYAPFSDTFTGDDTFWYGDTGGNMQFDLRHADKTQEVGKDKEGHVRFGSVNSNAGTPGKPETYPGAGWKITVNDAAAHTLTLFSPAQEDRSAKERFVLRSTTGEFPAAIVEFDGTQRGAIIQFRFIGNATLSVQQTVGGMGSSNPGANCAALFLD